MIKWEPKDKGYFISRYKKNLLENNFLKIDVEKIIENTKDILSKSINPNFPKNSGRLSSTNISLGYIQSGKTTSMEAVSCMARDNGFKLIIILSGHVINLADQTKGRVYESLDMYGWKKIEIQSGSKIDLSSTDNQLKNILSSIDDILLDEDEKPSLLIVSMKQHQRLDKVISIFTNAENSGIDLSKIPTLIIDDEADHYSLDTKSNSKKNSKDKNESTYYYVKAGDTLETISEKTFIPEDTLRNLNGFKEDEKIILKANDEIMIEKYESTTHRRIKRLRQLLPRHTFIGYTATPMANFLISTVNNLSPRSGTVLSPGSLYTGAKYFFGIEENKSKHVKLVTEKYEKGTRPKSLLEAIRVFVIGVACGMMNGDHKNKKKKRSMLIHPSTSRAIHTEYKDWTDGIIRDYSRAYKTKAHNIKDNSKRIDFSFAEIEKDFLNSYKEIQKTEKNFPKYDDQLIINIAKSLDEIKNNIELFNGEQGPMPFIDWDSGDFYAKILIGGIGLERGYTIKGLTISYVVRESGTDDTVYQRARFFGYHKSYIGFVRMYLPQYLISNFEKQYEQEIVLREKMEEVIDKGGDLRKELKRSFPFISSKYGPVRKNILGFNLKKFPNRGIVMDNQAHHLEIDRIKENKEIYETLNKINGKKKISEISNHSYAKNIKDIEIKDNLDLTDYTEKYISKINTFENTTDQYDILTDLVDWRKMKKNDAIKNDQNFSKYENLELAIMYMNDDKNFGRSINESDFNDQSSRIPVEQGANENRPGHAYLHCEFLRNDEPRWQPTPNKDSPYGTPIQGNTLKKTNKVATLQIYKFNILSKETGQIIIVNGYELKNIPYFRLYIPKILGSGFIAEEF
ncbi:LysM peptidoglycan-binding domain-containing protein [Candidatus Pelagibacter ubique]|nr:LysM peptidoglycan-binding domain-containing protein [Candidatus Pelagibacter ubique]